MNRRENVKKKLETGPSEEEVMMKLDIDREIHGPPYHPMESTAASIPHRDENPVVFMDFSSRGGVEIPRSGGHLTEPRLIGRMHFELRADLLPMTCANFLELCRGTRGRSISDGLIYHYKGTEIYRVLKVK